MTESKRPAPTRPPQRNTWAELRGLSRGLGTLPRVLWLPAPAADSARWVLALPGYLTDDTATLPLRAALSLRGHQTYGWGLGRNLGDLRSLVPRAHQRLLEIADGLPAQAADRRIDVIGWSLGGVIARELARLSPDLIRHIITLGTPIVGGPKYTVVAPRLARRGVDLDAAEREVARRNTSPLPVSSTSIYSKRDNIVAWEASFDPHPESKVEHVEVDTAHLEMGVSADVLKIIFARIEAASR